MSKEAFINEVYTTVVDSSYPKYYLSDKSLLLNLHNDLSDVYYDLFPVIGDSAVIKDLLRHAANTRSTSWAEAKLIKGKIITSRAQKYFFDRQATLVTNHSWTESRSRKEMEAQREGWDRLPGYEQCHFSFGQPVFDAEHQFAIIEMWMCCGSLCGHGCIYLFKKVKGHWVRVGKTNGAIS